MNSPMGYSSGLTRGSQGKGTSTITQLTLESSSNGSPSPSHIARCVCRFPARITDERMAEFSQTEGKGCQKLLCGIQCESDDSLRVDCRSSSGKALNPAAPTFMPKASSSSQLSLAAEAGEPFTS